ncbi:hypothetical protein Salat_2438200 [Sesamum alatum]|uniref:Uncharacterized protein n=1 Tax=Sesamum alatum TaxID=300844 RepID=A0AAE1XY50_9LAMI|nr:hypothetical protein Salat_2438200 [Sesamum alatum]
MAESEWGKTAGLTKATAEVEREIGEVGGHSGDPVVVGEVRENVGAVREKVGRWMEGMGYGWEDVGPRGVGWGGEVNMDSQVGSAGSGSRLSQEDPTGVKGYKRLGEGRRLTRGSGLKAGRGPGEGSGPKAGDGLKTGSWLGAVQGLVGPGGAKSDGRRRVTWSVAAVSEHRRSSVVRSSATVELGVLSVGGQRDRVTEAEMGERKRDTAEVLSNGLVKVVGGGEGEGEAGVRRRKVNGGSGGKEEAKGPGWRTTVEEGIGG